MNKAHDRAVMKKVEEHYKYIASKYPEHQILGVFLYGSQNYGTDTISSDVDTKAILIPTLEDLCFRRAVSKEEHLPNGEHSEVKDIREMVNNFRKQNINFIEILFTKYKIVNPKYATLWEKYFVSQREDIAHYNPQKALYSTSKQAVHTLKQGLNDGKKVGNALRLELFLEKYKSGNKYTECLVPLSKDVAYIKDLKTGFTEVDPKEAKQLMDYFDLQCSIAERYPLNPALQEKVDTLMNEGIMQLVKELNIDFK